MKNKLMSPSLLLERKQAYFKRVELPPHTKTTIKTKYPKSNDTSLINEVNEIGSG